MQYEFLKNFPKRMKNVGLYGVLIQNSIQKTSWKQFGFLKFDEQMNLIFAVMLYIMEQSLREENCTMDDIGAYIDTINTRYLGKEISYDDCRKLGDFVVNVILSNEGRAMYFDGYDFEENDYHVMHISYVANRIVYLDQEVRRTSYYLTDDGYNLILSTLEIENNMKLTIHEMIFQMHLEKQSYDKAVDEIKNVFNLMRIQLQKIQEAMGKIRRNALNYSVKDYEEILLENLDTISDTKEKFQKYRELLRTLNKIVRMESFQDDFYRKPLEQMLELSDDAVRVLTQLKTTVQSYDSLMEKLEVDISVVEREKERITELLEDYVREIHSNLGKIDHNSTITIRKRNIKMLKIQLPDWEENAGLYRLRLEDFIDKITMEGVELFEKNENAQEFFGSGITTRNLYDQVVGIGNVQIHLYKIEAQREYPITWKEVSRNSGGEGFLSAFVILSSLLYYMRRDDTDIFADKNEGKVLIMDNPFAQTNASHLLIPLMDMAKKSNTQLICLTGLGGESIYNRFDNIYVLNLIAASLRGGTQYLKAEHKRGKEPDELVTARIEVGDQMELLF